MGDFWTKRWTAVMSDERRGKKEALREKTNEEIVEQLELIVACLEKSSAKSDEYMKRARDIALELMGEK